MKSIVIKVQSFPNVSETFVIQAIVEAIKSGYEVQIVVDKLNALSNSSQQELIIKYNLLEKVRVLNNPTNKLKRRLDFIVMCLNPILVYYFIKYSKIRKKISLDYLYHLKFYKQFKKIPVFHIHFATALQPILYLKKIGYLNPKIVVTFHGYDAYSLPEKGILKELIHDYKVYVNHITTNSQYLKQILVDKGFLENQITVVQIGISTDLFKSDINKEINMNGKILKIISVGRLIPLKGQEYAIKAIQILIAKGYKVNLTIVGNGKDLNRLITLVNELQLVNYISFLGEKSQNELKVLLLHHDIFLMTSTRGVNGRSEAFGVVSLEAQAMGLPVIAFNSGGVSETLIHNQTGFLVEDKNTEAFAKAIQTLCDDNELYKKMSANAIHLIKERFDVKIATKQYQMLYEK